MWGFLVASRHIFILITTLLDHINTATTKKLDFKNSHLTSVGAKIHQPHLMKVANTSIQQALELFTAAAYSPGPEDLQDPTTGPEMVSQPARLKGFGLRPEG